jgi:ADP-ribosylglycohydrolase
MSAQIKEKLRQTIRGSLLGLVTGDSCANTWARLSPEEVVKRKAVEKSEGILDERILHGAVTTWTLSLLEALVLGGPYQSLKEDLSLRLQSLALPHRGRALRGGPQSLAVTLRQIAQAVDTGTDLSFASVQDVNAEIVPCALPFAFALGDSSDDVASALIDAVSLTHRNPRVVSGAAYFVGGMRQILRQRLKGADFAKPDPGKKDDNILDAAIDFQSRAINHWRQRKKDSPGSLTQAEGEAQIVHARAVQSSTYVDLIPPDGFDGRDMPIQLAASALMFRHASPAEIGVAFESLDRRGGDVDILFPMFGAVVGLVHGPEGIPLGWLTRIKTRDFIENRLEAILSSEPKYVNPLVDEEYFFSQQQVHPEPRLAVPLLSRDLTQMGFFEEPK